MPLPNVLMFLDKVATKVILDQINVERGCSFVFNCSYFKNDMASWSSSSSSSSDLEKYLLKFNLFFTDVRKSNESQAIASYERATNQTLLSASLQGRWYGEMLANSYQAVVYNASTNDEEPLINCDVRCASDLKCMSICYNFSCYCSSPFVKTNCTYDSSITWLKANLSRNLQCDASFQESSIASSSWLFQPSNGMEDCNKFNNNNNSSNGNNRTLDQCSSANGTSNGTSNGTVSGVYNPQVVAYSPHKYASYQIIGMDESKEGSYSCVVDYLKSSYVVQYVNVKLGKSFSSFPFWFSSSVIFFQFIFKTNFLNIPK
ncbi:hypothetical protein HELRODRAFT_168422 [Helobdella robusta]|uniref:Uncharacterized protein n=1 Tax=Helobdella robusta TaxID=6412 RepID=T1F0K6_HELRO|nr:hypothetical protein HELRODRAFT_168422 [Helobdella robusta]ESO09439.1 hypothetical protein HELRODRAFT_168422 [Helobdella robusta]